MADEKGAPSSGPGWGALEIIIGILLVIGLLDRLSGNSAGLFSGADAPAAATPSVIPADKNAQCGLSVARPASGEKASGAVQLSGTAGYCNWNVYNGIVLYAQVVDKDGTPVSAFSAVPVGRASSTDIVSFDTTIPLIKTPKKGTGYLILVPARQEKSQRTISVRIPLAL